MVSAQAASRSSVSNEVTVPYLYYIGGRTAAGTHCTAVPDPAVGGNQAASAGAEGVVFSVAQHDCGRVVYEGLTYLGGCGKTGQGK